METRPIIKALIGLRDANSSFGAHFTGSSIVDGALRAMLASGAFGWFMDQRIIDHRVIVSSVLAPKALELLASPNSEESLQQCQGLTPLTCITEVTSWLSGIWHNRRTATEDPVVAEQVQGQVYIVGYEEVLVGPFADALRKAILNRSYVGGGHSKTWARTRHLLTDLDSRERESSVNLLYVGQKSGSIRTMCTRERMLSSTAAPRPWESISLR